MKSVWTIAGSDSGGGAGIQADLNTFADFHLHGCSVITAITAQNTKGVSHIFPCSNENLEAQIVALKEDIVPAAIKLGMLFHPSLIKSLAHHLSDLNCPIVADPVLIATSGDSLSASSMIEAYPQYIFPLATLLTPNIAESEILTGKAITSFSDMEKAAEILLNQGARAVLIKGGDFDHQTLASDFFSDGTMACWINQSRLNTTHTHGTGCSLSAAIASALALGWSLIDSIIFAKAYVRAGLSAPRIIGQGKNPVGHPGLEDLSKHFPWVTDSPAPLAQPHLALSKPIGRYPIIDNIEDLRVLCTKGISLIQLRVKNPPPDFETICQQAQALCEAHQVKLIVNDQIGLGHGAHLGQEDIQEKKIPSTGLLGISAHNLYELARAYSHHPSYLAIGPVFETHSKSLSYPSIGLEKLKIIGSLSPLPLVAIGGIPYDRIPEILATGCSGVAFIQAAKDFIQDGRFDKHFALPGFTALSQQRLAQARVVCIGCGGLAAGFLPYLAAAGVGSLTLIDHDYVSFSNLQRQILFKENQVGQPKVEMAKHFLLALHSQIEIQTVFEKLTIDNALKHLAEYDLIIDGTDNFSAHYLINDTAKHLNIPLISASVYRDQGQLFCSPRGQACYRCLFPNPPSPTESPTCDTAGVLGTTPAFLGIMQAQAAVELLISPEKQKESICRTVNMKTWSVKNLTLKPLDNCQACYTLSSEQALRSLHVKPVIEHLSVEALKESLDAGHPVNLLDVREEHERDEYNIGGVHIPIQELPERLYELDPTLPYVVYCYSGGRSSMACEFLLNQGFKVKNLTGGMKAWKNL